MCFFQIDLIGAEDHAARKGAKNCTYNYGHLMMSDNASSLAYHRSVGSSSSSLVRTKSRRTEKLEVSTLIDDSPK